MRHSVRHLTTVASAALLCLVTLSVFASQVSGGPEAVLRRFHEGVAQRHRATVQETLVQSLDSPYSRQVIAFTDAMLSQRRDVTIYRSQTGGSLVLLEAQYVRAGFDPEVVVWQWVVRRERGRWKIDAAQSVEAMRRFYSP